MPTHVALHGAIFTHAVAAISNLITQLCWSERLSLVRKSSAQVADALARLLREDGLEVTVLHRDIDLPVVSRQATTGYAPGRPKVVVLCGSTRFMREMTEANCRLTAAGAVVLAPGCDMKNPHPLWDDPQEADDLKQRLDRLHRHKIAMADEVVVVSDATGYYGSSTRAELELVEQLGKPVRFMPITPADAAKG